MPTIRIPTPLRAYTNGQATVSVDAETAGQAMQSLVTAFPALQPHLYNEDGSLRAFVNIFLDGENLRDRQGLDTPLQPDDTLMIIPSIAGGQHAA